MASEETSNFAASVPTATRFGMVWYGGVGCCGDHFLFSGAAFVAARLFGEDVDGFFTCAERGANGAVTVVYFCDCCCCGGRCCRVVQLAFASWHGRVDSLFNSWSPLWHQFDLAAESTWNGCF